MASTFAVIEKLISLTKDSLKWEYIDENKAILSKCNALLEKFDTIVKNKSFYTQFGSGYFVILSVDSIDGSINGVFDLYLVAIPSLSGRDITMLNYSSEAQMELQRLLNLAIKQHPNTEDFLEDFMNS